MATQHGFWVVVTDNRVFDGVVTRHVIANSDIVALHGFYKSPSYSFSDIVTRLHLAGLGIRVLFYTWCGRKPLGGTTIGATPTLDGMEASPGLLLKDSDGEPIVHTDGSRRFVLLDPRVPRARQWLRDRVSMMASDVGSDGVALDGTIREPLLLSDVVDPDSYPPKFDLMLEGISTALPIAIFNNLSPRPDQERLLAFAHGASIEFFGLNDRTARPPTFAANILPYLRAIRRHDDKIFLVFGRASRSPDAYTTYEEDWRWQRYLYCAYLLAAGPNTRWKQHAGFLASPNSGRAGGLDVYGDALHDLGTAGGDYTVEDGIYRRAFARGLVLVSPSESRRPQSVLIGRPMFTPEGARVSRRITVAPGEGHLLLRRRPVPPPALIRQFGPKTNPLWRWSALQEEAGSWHLHLDRTTKSEECEHDLALDLIRYRAPRWRLRLTYRTSDPAARVETVVEVDDRRGVKRFAVVDSALAIGTGKPRPVQFRAVPAPASQFARLAVVGAGAPMIADGRWRTLVIDLDAACFASARYAFRRAVFARLLGSMDIRQLHLASRGVPRSAARPRSY
jgi:Hypothetical glycosyl hydrolase family 15